MISEELYKQVIDVIPILCVDIMLKNEKGEYLLIERAREPLKGYCWVIGGRVLKGENLKVAAIRKIKEETGISVSEVKLVGYYEDAFETNPFGLPKPQHSVSLVFSAKYDGKQQIQLDHQSLSWKFSKELPEKFNRVLIESLI